MKKLCLIVIALASLLSIASQAAEDRELKFMLADIEPFVIHEPITSEPNKGVHLELLQILARKLNRKVSFVALPTRRYLTGAYKAEYDGLVLADFLVDQLEVVRNNYEKVGFLFRSHLLLLQRRTPIQNRTVGELSQPAPGVVGAIGKSCDDALNKNLKYLVKFDIKDPKQGAMMLAKGRLDYLCLSDIVVHRLKHFQKAMEGEIDVALILTSYDFQLLLNKNLQESEKSLFRNGLKAAAKEKWFQELFDAYGIKPATN